ncbi:ABC transporter ATP-binding protein [Variovorax gossypii]|uniref:ABC transporter ATP-binding protein n=1 Tax=Variovorax gossypii TaxID=1679495 RepID=A0A3S0IFP3_9BURK|nr:MULTISPECIES: ABC transporter ATP-binding protein [Variovorax]MDR6522111.1 branched-chain amino acid transport system ATP-binding protein [Variovorax paradoxus]RTQ35587.1 ABC transporter ATP-binding protein [Variovorax gossypii]
MPSRDDLLRLDGVHTHIGEYHILQGVSFQVPRRGITALLGRNGAGKSTTLRTVMGLWRASAGAIQLGGQAISHLSTPEISRRGIAYVPEDMGIFASLTVQENVRLAALSSGLESERLLWIFELFPALRRFWLRPAGTLSGGQKQMLAIARAIIEPRQLLLIDEPTKGLAPGMVDSLIHALLELKKADTTILLVEQNFHFVSMLGDHVVVMDDGRIVHESSMADLVQQPSLQERLLGLDTEAAAHSIHER